MGKKNSTSDIYKKKGPWCLDVCIVNISISINNWSEYRSFILCLCSDSKVWPSELFICSTLQESTLNLYKKWTMLSHPPISPISPIQTPPGRPQSIGGLWFKGRAFERVIKLWFSTEVTRTLFTAVLFSLSDFFLTSWKFLLQVLMLKWSVCSWEVSKGFAVGKHLIALPLTHDWTNCARARKVPRHFFSPHFSFLTLHVNSVKSNAARELYSSILISKPKLSHKKHWHQYTAIWCVYRCKQTSLIGCLDLMCEYKCVLGYTEEPCTRIMS